jgi:hypothetical protein
MKNARSMVFFFFSLMLLLSFQGGLVVGDMKTPQGPEAFLAHVSTDKPIYRAGEDVYVRIIVVNALNNKPVSDSCMANMEIISPKGDAIARSMTQSQSGSMGWKWNIGDTVPGGDYKVKASFPNNGYPPAERSFNIRAFRQKRLRTQINFAREGYGPGDEVAATLEVSRSEGGIPAGATATVVARVDQAEAWRGETVIEDDGFAFVRFKLPETILEGDGTLSFAIEDGGVVETASKSIPILVSKVNLQAYPEGGDLVPDVENRVYFEAIAPNGRPADVTVELLDSKNKSLLKVKTEHEGRGIFMFTPQKGVTYTLQVVEPWNVKTKIAMPKPEGLIGLRSIKDKFKRGEPIIMEVTALTSCKVRISRFQTILDEKELDVKLLKGTPGWLPLGLSVPDEITGVLRVTVFDSEGTPRAERLIYREPSEKIKIEIEPDREGYVPGDKVKLKIKTFDQTGKPVPGFVGITVTDDAVLEMIETREKAPRLPVQVYLEHEVRELFDSHVYLSEDVKAPKALDLLLGTQGWRRFAFYTRDDFLKKFGDAGRRALADVQTPIPQPMPAEVWAMGGKPIAARGAVLDAVVINGALEANFDGVINKLDDKAAVPEVAERIPPQMNEPMPSPAPVVEEMGDIKKIMDLEQGVRKIRKPASFMSPDYYVAIREFALKVRANRQPNDRVDFSETVYWNAGIVTNEKGEADVSFDLSDSVTSFRILADGYTNNGSFGASDEVIESRRPFYIEAKTPLEVTAGDRIDLPVVLVNETDDPMEAALAVSANQGITIGEFPKTISLPAKTRQRLIVPCAVESKTGLSELIVTASSGAFTDNVTRTIPVAPLGFPISLSFSGLLENKTSHNLTIPESLTEGGVKAQATVYPSPLANLTQALEALIRDPSGCFEQTSSTNYPLVMAMQYFETHQGVDPDLKKRSREKLSKGYERLAGFECKEKGYEWFGGDPGHEALTAYGLLEFSDMADVQPVDASMMERTRAWLLSRRDGNGGFKRNDKALDSFGRAPAEITNAYITWALANVGEKDIKNELEASLVSAQKSEDPYHIALVAGALIESGRAGDASPLLKRLAGMQDKDGSVKGAKTTITCSGGDSLLVETTSLAILAWLSDNNFAGSVERGMKWLCETCEGGRFGSTQSTVLALKAIVAYDKSRSKPKADGSVALILDGKEIGTLDFTRETQTALEFKDMAAHLLPGAHEIALEMRGGSPMPYSVTVEYHAEKPADSETCPLELETSVTEKEVKEGEPVEVVARLKNTKEEGLPFTLAIVGIPGGLEPRHEQLRESVKAGKFAFYEILGRDVAIYFRDLEPGAEREIVISAIGAVPGRWVGPSSRAYLYYTPEEKKWNDGLKITVTPK